MGKELLYGYSDIFESFCVADASHVRVMASEYAAVQACRTFGDLRRIQSGLAFVNIPEDLEGYDEPDETPWNWEETARVGDGDWPAMPTSLALNDLELSDLQALWAIDGVGNVTTTLNGDYLHIPLESEQLMVECLTRRGYVVSRDDTVFDWGM
jgi:hypothetical protein